MKIVVFAIAVAISVAGCADQSKKDLAQCNIEARQTPRKLEKSEYNSFVFDCMTLKDYEPYVDEICITLDNAATLPGCYTKKSLLADIVRKFK